MTEYLLDANVIVRFIAGDGDALHDKAAALFARADAGGCRLHVAPWIVAEVVYVLTRVYKHDRKDVAAAVKTLLLSPGIVAADGEIVVDALTRFASRSIDFADALLVATAVATGVRPASFDRDLDKFKDANRYEPGTA